MAKHQVDVVDDTGYALEDALAALRAAGMPDDAKVRIKVRTASSFNADGGYARTMTATWTDDPTGNGNGGGPGGNMVPAVPPPISQR